VKTVLVNELTSNHFPTAAGTVLFRESNGDFPAGKKNMLCNITNQSAKAVGSFSSLPTAFAAAFFPEIKQMFSKKLHIFRKKRNLYYGFITKTVDLCGSVCYNGNASVSVFLFFPSDGRFFYCSDAYFLT